MGVEAAPAAKEEMCLNLARDTFIAAPKSRTRENTSHDICVAVEEATNTKWEDLHPTARSFLAQQEEARAERVTAGKRANVE